MKCNFLTFHSTMNKLSYRCETSNQKSNKNLLNESNRSKLINNSLMRFQEEIMGNEGKTKTWTKN